MTNSELWFRLSMDSFLLFLTKESPLFLLDFSFDPLTLWLFCPLYYLWTAFREVL